MDVKNSVLNAEMRLGSQIDGVISQVHNLTTRMIGAESFDGMIKLELDDITEQLESISEELDIFERKMAEISDENRELYAIVHDIKKKLDKYIKTNNKKVKEIEEGVEEFKQSINDRVTNLKRTQTVNINPGDFAYGGHVDWNNPYGTWTCSTVKR